uniref:Uncharacterized protein n=1 Tax=Panagrolaimus sp. ES5 TaxID=591445 RepID=A0AC34G8B1_9BILA
MILGILIEHLVLITQCIKIVFFVKSLLEPMFANILMSLITCYDYAATLFFSLVEFTSDDTRMTNVGDGLSELPAEIIRFFGLSTSRYASKHPKDHVMYESLKTYFMEPGRYGFTSSDLGDGKYLALGASKVVVPVEGPRNQGALAVIIDSKKTPFYHSINLLEMICNALKIDANITPNRGHWEFAVIYVKRLEWFFIYGRRQDSTVILNSLTNSSGHDTLMEYHGKQISIVQYLEQCYYVEIRFHHWPLA